MHPQLAAAIRTTVFLLFIAVVAGGFYLALADRPFGLDLSSAGISRRLQSLGPWRGLGFMVLMVLHSFVPFPAEVVTLMAGRSLGLVWGTVYVWSGAMLGAMLAFALARAFGKAFVEAVMPEPAFARVKAWSSSKSATSLLVARFIPVIAFNLVNYAAGLTSVRWWTFTWTTGLGILPLTIFFVSLGERMSAASWQDWALFGAAVVPIALAVHLALRHARRRGWIDG